MQNYINIFVRFDQYFCNLFEFFTINFHKIKSYSGVIFMYKILNKIFKDNFQANLFALNGATSGDEPHFHASFKLNVNCF